MHLVFATRGIKREVDTFLTFMQTQMFWWQRKSLAKLEKLNAMSDDEIKKILLDNKISLNVEYDRAKVIEALSQESARVQGALRPIQLWEYIFPEENLPEVLTMLDAQENGENLHPFLARANAKMLRTAMALKPVPKYKKVSTDKFIYKDGVGLYLLGIKKDKRRIWKEVGYEQEML